MINKKNVNYGQASQNARSLGMNFGQKIMMKACAPAARPGRGGYNALAGRDDRGVYTRERDGRPQSGLQNLSFQ